MALTEGQVQVGPLVMGRGTPYRVLSDFDPFSIQVRADTSGDRAWSDGGWSGAEFAATRVVTLTVVPEGAPADGVAGWLPLHQQLAAAMAPVGTEARDVELRFARGGHEFLMFGRPRMVEPDGTLIGTGKSYTRLAFVALDPVIYSGELVEESLGLPEFEGGLTVPFTVPFTIDAVAIDGEVDLTNEGTTKVGLHLTVKGPVVEPRVALLHPDGTRQMLRFHLTLQTGQWLDVDTKARSVLLNGVASRRGDVSGEWPMLPGQPVGAETPEPSSLLFRAADDNDVAQVTVSHRHGWR